jgi:hypothetical protein
VTIFRSSLAGVLPATSGAPHPLQNLATSGFAVPQPAQITARA